MKLNIFIHGNTTESNTAMTKKTGNISTNIPVLTQPTLMHYELCFLCVAHACPYDKQSSCTISTATAILYIWVTKHSDLHMESASPNEGHSHRPSFS